MNRLAAAMLLGLAIFVTPTEVSSQIFDPRNYQTKTIGKPTQIMVLGTAHLSGTPDDWNPKVLEPLLDRLAAFKPDIITTEDQSGPALTKLWEYREIAPRAAATYGGRALRMATEAGVSLDMDMPQAGAAVRKQLLDWPADPTPADRRRLTALFAAAGDPHSALVQWWRLPEGERIAGEGVSQRLATQLGELGRSRNESVVIAARLANRLGLERLYPTDSQDEEVFTPHEASLFFKSVFPPILERFNADPVLKGRGEISRMTDGEKTLAEYRKLNSPAINRRSSEVEWLGVIDRPIKEDVGRKRVAGWEVRNMRMAANIREASARAPGGRVLVIVGAAHKVWLEAYLSMMADVEIVSTNNTLK